MKQKVLFFILIILLSFFYGCSNENSIFGNYEFKDVIFLSPLSSSTVDYMKDKMKGTKYTIQKDIFSISSKDNQYEILNPTYIKEKIDDNIIQDFNNAVFKDSISFNEYKEKHRYTIYSKNKQKAKYYLYSLDNELWIASYVDNTANKQDIIMYIFRIK